MHSDTFNTQCTPSYRLLTEEQIHHFHFATLELLETVGVRVFHSEALDMLAGADCRIHSDQVVRIPAHLVEQSIRSAPSEINIFSRSGRQALSLGKRKVHFGPGTDLTRTYDLDTGRMRQSGLQDVVNAARLADALDEIDFIASHALPYDSPTHLMYLDSLKAEMENSIKPIFFTAAGKKDLRFMHSMAAAVAGGKQQLKEKPFLIHYAEPLSPLTHTAEAIDKLLFCADHGIPITYTPGMMSGATAPATLAGAITMGNAEALSGLVIHQLRAEGAPIISGFGMSTFDMKTSACVYACPEYRLALSACADLYHHYDIPMWGTAGVSDSHNIDQQAGMEWTASLLTAVLDGANLVHDVGYLGQGLIGHPAALVVCAEIISYVRRFAEGFEMDSEHLALEAIRQTGPQGSFLPANHTLEHFRTEHWQPDLINRSLLNTWQRHGERTWGEKAIQKAKKLLDNHHPEPLPTVILKNLEELRQQALRELNTQNPTA